MGDGFRIGEKRLIYQGGYIAYHRVQMHFPDGSGAEWDLIHHNGAAAMLAETPDGNILMIHQYRPGEDRIILEIPAGGINPGEDTKAAAIREMQEETGAVCVDVDHLITVMPSPAYNDEKVTVYCGKIKEFTSTHLDENEFVTVQAYPLEELIQKVMDGEIRDSKTIAAVFAYREKKSKTK